MNALCSFFVAFAIYSSARAASVHGNEMRYYVVVSMLNFSTALTCFKKYMKAE